MTDTATICLRCGGERRDTWGCKTPKCAGAPPGADQGYFGLRAEASRLLRAPGEPQPDQVRRMMPAPTCDHHMGWRAGDPRICGKPRELELVHYADDPPDFWHMTIQCSSSAMHGGSGQAVDRRTWAYPTPERWVEMRPDSADWPQHAHLRRAEGEIEP